MAVTTVENLEFHIKKSGMSSEGAQVLKDYASALEALQKAKKGGQISQNLVNSISALAGAMKAIDSKAVSMMRQLAAALKTFEGLKGISLNKDFAARMADIAAAADLLDDRHITRLYRFGSAMKNMQGAKTSIGDKLPDQLLNLAAAADLITDATIARIERLTEALSKLRGIDLRGLGSVMSEQRKAQAAAQQAQQRQNNQKPAGGQTTQQPAGNGGREAIQWTWSLKKNADLAKNAFAQMASSVLKIHPAVKLVASVLGGIVKSVLKIAAGIAKWAFKTVLGLVKRVAAGIKSIAQGVINVGKNLVKNWYEHSVFKSLEESIKQVQKLIHSVGRVALYRAIRSAIKYVTDELKEGTENAYWFSREFGNATHYISEAYDNLSSKNFKMSNQLGAAWSTLIATIEPILIRLINLVTKAAEAFTQFFAILGGSSTYLKAVDYNKQWAESADEAADAAREWKNQLMDFDTLNRLNDNDNSSRGKGSTLPDYENMFEEVPVSSWFEKLKDMLKSGKWGEIGEMLGDKFNDLVNKFDWDRWGKKIGEKIQGAIDLSYKFLKRADFRNLGEKIVDFIDHCADEIDFEELGRLSTRIRTALYDVLYGAFTKPGSMKKLAANLSNFVLGALTELAEWLESLSPEKIATALSDFFGNIKYGEIKDAFVRVIKAAWRLVIDTKDMFLQSETGQKVTQKLAEYFGGLTWDDIKRTIKEKLSSAWTWACDRFDEIWPPTEREKFKNAAIEKVKEIGTQIGDALWDGFKNSTVGQKVIRAMEIIHAIHTGLFVDAKQGWEELYRLFHDSGEKAGTTVVNGFSGQSGKFGEAMDKTMIDPSDEKMKNLETRLGIGGQNAATSAANGFIGHSGKIDEAMNDGLIKPADNAVVAFMKKIGLIKVGYAADAETWKQISGDVEETTKKNYDSIGTEVPKSIDNMKKLLDGSTVAIYKLFETMRDKSKSAAETMKNQIGNTMTMIRDSVSKVGEGIGSALSKMIETIGTGLSGTWKSITGGIGSMIDGIKSALGIGAGGSSVFQSIGQSMVSGLQQGFTGLWNSFSSTVSSLVSTLISGISSAVQQGFSGLSGAIGTAVSTASGKLNELAAAAKNSINSLLGNAKTSLNGIVTSIQTTINSIISKANQILSKLRVKSYAAGGFPEDGLFFANHSELVGQFSNGKTAVANNEQIVSALEQGVYRAVTNAMGNKNSAESGNEMNIYIGDELVYSGYAKWNKRQTLITGGRA